MQVWESFPNKWAFIDPLKNPTICLQKKTGLGLGLETYLVEVSLMILSEKSHQFG